MRQKLLVLGIAAILAGCGSDSKNRTPVTGGATGGTEISGAAMAPGGSVLADLQPQHPLQVVINFLISPAAAAITGLSAVADADVELFRIDNDGNATSGTPLAATTTNADGEYTLELPEGEEMGGDLVLIISAGGNQMRAQVIAEQVDITPVSEYVLSKLIASDADLTAVSKEDIIELQDRIEDLDLDGGTDLTTLLTQLDAVASDMVAESLEVIVAAPGDAGSIAGDYRNVAVQWGLEHGEPWGDNYAVDSWVTDITLSAGANGGVNFSLASEDLYFVSQHLPSGGLWYELGEELLDETLVMKLSDNGLLSFSQALEEEIDGDYAERTPSKVYKFREVPSADMFVLEGNDMTDIYDAVDSDQNGEADSFGDAIVGQEAFRGIEFLLKKPAAATNASMKGDFGRVYIGTSLDNTGWLEIESEQNVLTFDGAGALSSSAAAQFYIARGLDGTASHFSCQAGDVNCAEAEAGLSYTLSADGSFAEIGGGQNPPIFVNDAFNFLVGTEMEITGGVGNNADAASHSLTLAVKLPTTGAPTIGAKVYRVLQVENEFSDNLSLNMLRPTSIMTMEGETQASFDASISDLELDSVAPLLVVENESDLALPVSVEVGSNDSVIFTIENAGDVFVMQGFLSEDASFGILQTRYTPSGATEATALGVAVLMEVTE